MIDIKTNLWRHILTVLIRPVSFLKLGMNENVEPPTQDPQDNEIHKFNYIMHERKTVKEKMMSSLKGVSFVVEI